MPHNAQLSSKLLQRNRATQADEPYRAVCEPQPAVNEPWSLRQPGGTPHAQGLVRRRPVGAFYASCASHGVEEWSVRVFATLPQARTMNHNAKMLS